MSQARSPDDDLAACVKAERNVRDAAPHIRARETTTLLQHLAASTRWWMAAQADAAKKLQDQETEIQRLRELIISHGVHPDSKPKITRPT